MVAPPDAFVAYSDVRSQEVAIGAAVFDDPVLREDYLGGDIYYALARMLGWTDDPDQIRWKREHSDQRDKAKVIQLGVGYGMSVTSLATHLNRHPLIGAEVLDRYRRRYPDFWRGREAAAERALEERMIQTASGWTLHLSHSPNERALFNFKLQGNAAEQMRAMVVRLCNAGIVPVMPVHDAMLFEETDIRRIEEAEDIMRAVGRKTCGFEIGVDRDQLLRGGERYQDKRREAKELWAIIMNTLVEIGALKKAA
jgi:DNA polymerase I-like protein with 3'-5' exonuclease and polymerase domains